MAGGDELRSEPGEIDLLDKLATVLGVLGLEGVRGELYILQIDQLMIEMKIIGSLVLIKIMMGLLNKR